MKTTKTETGKDIPIISVSNNILNIAIPLKDLIFIIENRGDERYEVAEPEKLLDALQKLQQPTSVKASERLPPLDQEIFVTVDGRKCVGKFYEGGKSFSYRNFSNFGNIVERDFDRIEWLDETTQSESVSNNT